MIKSFNPKNTSVPTRDTLIGVGKNDKFSIKGESKETGLVYAQVGTLRASDNNFTFFLEPGKIRIDGSRDSVNMVKISGTVSNDDYAYITAKMNAFYKKRTELFERYKKQLDKTTPENEKILNQAYSMKDSVTACQVDFATKHPASMASGMMVYLLQDNVPVSLLETLYTNLAEPVKKLSLLSRTPEKILAKKRNVIGAQAANFTMKDVNGKEVQLNDFKGKYVLIDFWASWCAPCRAENPPLVKAYSKFKEKGFEIVSISSDKSEAAWKKAIKQDNLTWVHLSDLTGGQNPVYVLYGVQPIPDNFLINPDGKIIARALHGDEVYNKLAEIFPSDK